MYRIPLQNNGKFPVFGSNGAPPTASADGESPSWNAKEALPATDFQLFKSESDER